MIHLVQAGIALALLVGLPIFLEPPTTDDRMIAAAFGALFLASLAGHGVVGYVRSRKPKSYLDSVMPPMEPPRK